MQIYINRNNQQLGPFEEAKVLQMLESGELSLNDLGIRHGGESWQKLGELFPNSVKQPVLAVAAPPTKSRKGLLLGCGGFFLISLLVGGVLGFFAYRNLFPTGTAENLPGKIGNFQIEDAKDLSSPKGNIWGTEKQYNTKYKNTTGGYALIFLTDYADEAAAEKFYAGVTATEWCKGDDPLYLSYKKGSVETSKITYCKSIFVKQKNQVFNIVVLSTSRVEDAKDILDNLPFNIGAAGEVKK